MSAFNCSLFLNENNISLQFNKIYENSYKVKKSICIKANGEVENLNGATHHYAVYQSTSAILSNKDRVIKTGHSIALIILTLGVGLFFYPIQSNLRQAYTGKAEVAIGLPKHSALMNRYINPNFQYPKTQNLLQLISNWYPAADKIANKECIGAFALKNDPMVRNEFERRHQELLTENAVKV